jgi:hypothetical protein
MIKEINIFDVWAWLILLLCIVGIAVSPWFPVQSGGEQVWPDEGPSEIFGQTLMQEPTPCAPCECRDCESGTWLAQFVHHLDNLAENPREIRDVLNRAYTETRLTPSAVSETGDWGICQINARAWPDVDTERLLVDPEYAAVECLRVYRVYFKICGPRWQECYRKGRRGAR